MMTPQPKPPGYVLWVVRTLEEAGYETWSVGGAIRNTLLGLPAGDWDLTTRAPPPVVQRLFPRTVPVGVEHGTVGVLTRQGLLLEVTTFRKDVETTGRHAVVEFAETLQEDLARRDFTVNAVAWHPLRKEFCDPFSGRADLDAKVLRTVGDSEARFSEDYLRVLRALRFSGRFKLHVERATWKALCSCVDRLQVLSPERTREELLKVLGEDQAPSEALSLYDKAGVLAALYPEVAAMKGCSRPGGEEDLWAHTLALVDLLSPRRIILRLAALLHGVGVPGEPVDWEEVATRGRERAAALLIRGRYSNQEIKDVTELIGMGLEPPLTLSSPSLLRQWLHRSDPDHLRSFGRIWLAKARLDLRSAGRDPWPVVRLVKAFRREKRSGTPLRITDLALDGRDLIAMGFKPGPRFGEILDGLMERVLEDPSLNTKEQLVELVREARAGKEEGP
ncbi:MAG: CCA tRNA nucleotidyltransferase [Gemmatimonadota bacterium]|jgi:tRNA nucleotidyltransferase (CCA-adding enzyme)